MYIVRLFQLCLHNKIMFPQGWIVMCMAQPEAVSWAKPGQNRPSRAKIGQAKPGQARPKWWLHEGFGLAWQKAELELAIQAVALCIVVPANALWFCPFPVVPFCSSTCIMVLWPIPTICIAVVWLIPSIYDECALKQPNCSLPSTSALITWVTSSASDMCTMETIKQLIKKISSLSASLSDSIPKSSKHNKISSVMNSMEHDTPHEMFNGWFDVLFGENCHDSHGRLYYVC